MRRTVEPNLSGIALVFNLILGAWLLIMPLAAHAQGDCDAVLRDGVFNKFNLRQNSYSSMVLAWQLAQMTTSEARQKVKAGLTIPIDGLPVSGNFDDEQFNAWKQSVRESLNIAQTAWNDVSISQLTASPDLLNTWSDCMASRKGVIAELDVLDDRNLVYRVKYVPSGPTMSAKITSGLTITGGAPVNNNELALLTTGKGITVGGASIQIRRNKPAEPVSITINTDSGPGNRYAGRIVPVPKFPAKPPGPDLTRWYFLKEVNSGYYLNVFAGRFGSIQQPLCVAPATPSHEWKFKAVGPDRYEIVARIGGTVVGRYCRCNNISDGIVQGAPNDSAQVWELMAMGGGRYHIRAAGSQVYISLGVQSNNPAPHFALRQTGLADAAVWELQPQGVIQ